MQRDQSKARNGVKPARVFTFLSFAAIAVMASGCNLRNAVPRTEITGSIAGQPFTVQAPKDTDLTGLNITAETNGSVSITIEKLVTRMNPEVITTTGDAQAKLIQASGDMILKTIQGGGAAAAQALGKP